MKAYELALDHIEEGILSGRYEVGSILPPERELATQLGIGRSSVREAIRALESQGVLDSAVGAGPASGTRVTSDQSRALTRLLKLHVSLGKYPVDDVVEAGCPWSGDPLRSPRRTPPRTRWPDWRSSWGPWRRPSPSRSSARSTPASTS